MGKFVTMSWPLALVAVGGLFGAGTGNLIVEPIFIVQTMIALSCFPGDMHFTQCVTVPYSAAILAACAASMRSSMTCRKWRISP